MSTNQTTSPPPANEPLDRQTLSQLFELAVRTREQELHHFWQRSNLFLLLDSGAVAVFFSIGNSAPSWTLIVFALFGLVISGLWFALILGGKYWQIRWEAATSRLELQYAPTAKLFAATRSEIRKEVKDFIGGNSRRWWLSRLNDQLILIKPSPSLSMEILSLLFGLVWLILLFK